MSGQRRRRKSSREKNLTEQLLGGQVDERDQLEFQQRFSQRSRRAQKDKMERTALLRAGEGQQTADIQSLPVGQVVQVYSRYCQVDHPTGPRLCVVRKTLAKLAQTSIVVGDWVRFRDGGDDAPAGKRVEAVIEEILPRKTVLTRADSFQGKSQHPIVANAEQMLIVVSIARPRVKWGLVDRMLVAAQSGGVRPMVCLNKIDLADEDEGIRSQLSATEEVMGHYQSLGVVVFRTSAEGRIGIEAVAQALAGKTTVLAGHSGVGKSTLISIIQPGLDIRIGEISGYNEKGRHTTTSARRYSLDGGGYVVDTPGLKMFGLWGVSRDNIEEFFPDIKDGTAPRWRVESFEQIRQSL